MDPTDNPEKPQSKSVRKSARLLALNLALVIE